MKKTGFALLALGLLAMPAVAQAPAPFQNPEGVVHVSGTEANRLMGAKVVDHLGTHFIYRKPEYQQELVYRDASGVPEVHAAWADHFVVTEGAATLVVGGTVVNPKETGPGEVRGTAITGGTEYALTPGTNITVPRGVPHWTVLKPGAHMRAVVFKLKD